MEALLTQNTGLSSMKRRKKAGKEKKEKGGGNISCVLTYKKPKEERKIFLKHKRQRRIKTRGLFFLVSLQNQIIETQVERDLKDYLAQTFLAKS